MPKVHSSPQFLQLRDPKPDEVNLGKFKTPEGCVLKVQILKKITE